ncbi:hypothetical protein KOAAANKH_02540 [Brevundimonas sp. NIBR10]|uniref:hypothetical protein n=1 Tax=Brevundimonas sp. NIBR10 TaxID=3015997 RepID=UPI0022F18250|nr:hypothetical protein [Brevundimonas sp. NIBR10]WGM47658.1 hypothetical protein KOAAANKH_02540 [Brevundimonas sp. NIBR10]
MKVKTPKEDPRIASARDREERRADAAFVENASGILDDETRKRIRRFGKRGGSVRATATGASASTGGSGASSSGGGSFDPGAFGGVGGGSGGFQSGGATNQQQV